MDPPARSYPYVGPRDLLDLAQADIGRCEPSDALELDRWIHEQKIGLPGSLSFVVTEGRRLRVAPRQAEHVACARARAVLAAGELELTRQRGQLRVVSVTNQSTGYCPEPSCFPEIANALTAIGLTPPPGLSHEFIFRRCPQCHSIVVVKEDDFVCPCGADLPATWNLAPGLAPQASQR